MIPGYRPDFAQCIDPSRPHELLTKDTKWSGQLHYRYTDDGSTILVPNVPYNQTRATRARYFEFCADERETSATGWESGAHAEALRLTPAARKRMADEIRTRAGELRDKAREILASGDPDHVGSY